MAHPRPVPANRIAQTTTLRSCRQSRHSTSCSARCAVSYLPRGNVRPAEVGAAVDSPDGEHQDQQQDAAGVQLEPEQAAVCGWARQAHERGRERKQARVQAGERRARPRTRRPSAGSCWRNAMTAARHDDEGDPGATMDNAMAEVVVASDTGEARGPRGVRPHAPNHIDAWRPALSTRSAVSYAARAARSAKPIVSHGGPSRKTMTTTVTSTAPLIRRCCMASKPRRRTASAVLRPRCAAAAEGRLRR